jgi:hypothetical protein
VAASGAVAVGRWGVAASSTKNPPCPERLTPLRLLMELDRAVFSTRKTATLRAMIAWWANSAARR